mmetsp:Transcript_85667/g.207552  ORF Transcript_85667/g.207552 Transcript_85667/m.207552 type:complete len:310 (-) Transcript_85667:18-947(-)
MRRSAIPVITQAQHQSRPSKYRLACARPTEQHAVRIPHSLRRGTAKAPGRQPHLVRERQHAAGSPQPARPPEAVPREAKLRQALLLPDPLHRVNAKDALPAEEGCRPPRPVEGVARRHDDLLGPQRVGVEELAAGGARAAEDDVVARGVPRRQAHDGALGVLVEGGGPRAGVLGAGRALHEPVHLPGRVDPAVHVELGAAHEEHPPRLRRARLAGAAALGEVAVEGRGALAGPGPRVGEAPVREVGPELRHPLQQAPVVLAGPGHREGGDAGGEGLEAVVQPPLQRRRAAAAARHGGATPGNAGRGAAT